MTRQPSACQRKPRRVCRPQAAKQVWFVFCGGAPQGDFRWACTSQKTLLSLQVWNLFAFSEQIMRAADCKPFVKKGLCPFLTVIKGAVSSRDSPLCMYFDEIAQEEGIKDLRFPPANSRTPPETGRRHRPAASGSSRHRPPSSARPPASALRRRRPVRR